MIANTFLRNESRTCSSFNFCFSYFSYIIEIELMEYTEASFIELFALMELKKKSLHSNPSNCSSIFLV